MSRLILGLLVLTICSQLISAQLSDEEPLVHRLAKRRLVIRVPSMRNPDSEHLTRILNKMAFAELKQKKLDDFENEM